MRTALLCTICCLFSLLGMMPVTAQATLETRQGVINFNASSPLEKIQAENEAVNAIYLPEKGDLGIVLLIADFNFPKPLMQEHFNEDYLESEKFPKATFRGKLSRVPAFPLESEVETEAKGTLTIHGEAREVTIPVNLTPENGGILLETDFIVRPEDHKIKVPRFLFKKIAREVQVEVSLPLQPEE